MDMTTKPVLRAGKNGLPYNLTSYVTVVILTPSLSLATISLIIVTYFRVLKYLRQSKFGNLLCFLALFDFIFICCILFHDVITTSHELELLPIKGYGMYAAFYLATRAVKYVVAMVIAWLLVIILLQRLRRTMKPGIHIQVFTTVTLATLLSITRWFDRNFLLETDDVTGARRITRTVVREEFGNSTYKRTMAIIEILACFLIPVFFGILPLIVGVTLKYSAKRSRENATFVVIVMVLISISLQTPYWICKIVSLTADSDGTDLRTLNLVTMLFYNSVPFFRYCVYSLTLFRDKNASIKDTEADIINSNTTNQDGSINDSRRVSDVANGNIDVAMATDNHSHRREKHVQTRLIGNVRRFYKELWKRSNSKKYVIGKDSLDRDKSEVPGNREIAAFDGFELNNESFQSEELTDLEDMQCLGAVAMQPTNESPLDKSIVATRIHDPVTMESNSEIHQDIKQGERDKNIREYLESQGKPVLQDNRNLFEMRSFKYRNSIFSSTSTRRSFQIDSHPKSRTSVTSSKGMTSSRESPIEDLGQATTADALDSGCDSMLSDASCSETAWTYANPTYVQDDALHNTAFPDGLHVGSHNCRPMARLNKNRSRNKTIDRRVYRNETHLNYRL